VLLFVDFQQFAEADGTLSFPKKVAGGLFSGALGSFIANPLDLSLVRMQADAKLPPAERRNYKNVFDAVIRVGSGAMAFLRLCTRHVVP
jgi:solute carrier family 25 oxoglutarate transporter 11